MNKNNIDMPKRAIGSYIMSDVDGYFVCPNCKGEFSHWAIDIDKIAHCPFCDLKVGSFKVGDLDER